MNGYNPLEDNYKKFILDRPHVVILGAGATMAAIPSGDKYGNKCSVMNGFIDNLGLRDILQSVEIETKSENLEDIYSELSGRPDCIDVCRTLEECIIDKFSELTIPDQPTVYDYLLISLRSKDYIFSFNWDDLIIQAYQRVYKITNNLPQLVFLHGNINVGRCLKCGSIESLRNRVCRFCSSPLIRPKILFPVKQKDYGSDEYIKKVWNGFFDLLSRASTLTIFGYSAPKSDVYAIKAMERAFSSTFRKLDQIEIIDIKDEDELYDTWKGFIKPTNDHFKVCKSIFDSILSEFPRRSIEGYYKRNFCNWWGASSVSLTPNLSFNKLKQILNPLIENENNNNFECI